MTEKLGIFGGVYLFLRADLGHEDVVLEETVVEPGFVVMSEHV